LVLTKGNDPLSIGYQPIALPLSYASINFGTKSWTRTNHTQCFKLVLYLMSYLGTIFFGVSNGDRTHTDRITICNATTTS